MGAGDTPGRFEERATGGAWAAGVPKCNATGRAQGAGRRAQGGIGRVARNGRRHTGKGEWFGMAPAVHGSRARRHDQGRKSCLVRVLAGDAGMPSCSDRVAADWIAQQICNRRDKLIQRIEGADLLAYAK